MATDTTPTTIDLDAATVTRTIFVRAPIAAVWAAITVPELIEEWFADSVRIDDLAPGASGVLTWSGHGDFPIIITEVDAPRIFAFRWNETGEPIDDSSSTLPRFLLAEEAGGTAMSVTESGFTVAYPDADDRAAALEGNRGGWDEKLDDLIAVLEKQDSQ